jgi:hypothetical protein
VVAVDEAHDIAVLKPTQNSPFPEIRVLHSPTQNITVKPSLGTLDPRQLRDGEPVFTSGYPLELPILITTRTALGAPWEKIQAVRPWRHPFF